MASLSAVLHCTALWCNTITAGIRRGVRVCVCMCVLGGGGGIIEKNIFCKPLHNKFHTYCKYFTTTITVPHLHYEKQWEHCCQAKHKKRFIYNRGWKQPSTIQLSEKSRSIQCSCGSFQTALLPYCSTYCLAEEQVSVCNTPATKELFLF